MRLPTVFRTSVFQLTLMYMALFGLSVVALFAFMYWTTIGYLERQTDAVIQADIEGLREQYAQRQLPGLVEVVRERVRRDTEGRSAYLVVDANLRPVAGNVSYWPREFNRGGEWVNFLRNRPDRANVPVRARVLAVGPSYRLMVGREVLELQQINQEFRRASIWGLSLTMGLALVGGLLMALSAQRRIAQLNRTTRQIIAGDLSQRVPLSGGQDEHEDLARNVNAMLDQIERLLNGLRHVGDSIAHDLRGPLTRLRTRLESLTDEPQPGKAQLFECLAQADALLNTFNALLRIARVESGAYRSAFASVDLSQIVGDVAELYQAAAEDKHIRLSCQIAEHAHVFGDRELLAQALTNILDNAIKYTPAGGRISLRLSKGGDTVSVSVADSGPGVPAADRERVLARFARLDEARSKPGNGLGLALVRAVAEQHDGKLTLDDNAPGLIVFLELPARPIATPAPTVDERQLQTERRPAVTDAG
jgi:signal transduction histidine kinase